MTIAWNNTPSIRLTDKSKGSILKIRMLNNAVSLDPWEFREDVNEKIRAIYMCVICPRTPTAPDYITTEPIQEDIWPYNNLNIFNALGEPFYDLLHHPRWRDKYVVLHEEYIKVKNPADPQQYPWEGPQKRVIKLSNKYKFGDSAEYGFPIVFWSLVLPYGFSLEWYTNAVAGDLALAFDFQTRLSFVPK